MTDNPNTLATFPKEIFLAEALEKARKEVGDVDLHSDIKNIRCFNARRRVAVYKLDRVVEVIAEPVIVAEVG